MLRCFLVVLVLLGQLSVTLGKKKKSKKSRKYTENSTSAEDPLRTFVESYTPGVPSSFFTPLTHDEVAESNKLIIFLHIPKTAGQSFHRYLGAALNGPKAACLKVGFEKECEESKKGNGSHGKGQPPVTRFDLVFAGTGKHKNWHNVPNSLVEEATKVRGFLGHFDMSLTQPLGDFDMLFMTVLRRPRDRLLSWYSYLKSNSEDIEYCIAHRSEEEEEKSGRCEGQIAAAFMRRPTATVEEFQSNQQRNWKRLNGPLLKSKMRSVIASESFGPRTLPSNVTFQEFVAKLRLMEVDNYVTRALAGAHKTASFYNNSRNNDMDDQTMLALAKDMLRKFSFVGIHEQYGDTIKLLEFVTGQQLKLNNYNFNTTPRKSNTTASEDADIEKNEWMDNEIYELGLQLFKEQLANMNAAKGKSTE